MCFVFMKTTWAEHPKCPVSLENFKMYLAPKYELFNLRAEAGADLVSSGSLRTKNMAFWKERLEFDNSEVNLLQVGTSEQ